MSAGAGGGAGASNAKNRIQEMRGRGASRSDVYDIRHGSGFTVYGQCCLLPPCDSDPTQGPAMDPQSGPCAGSENGSHVGARAAPHVWPRGATQPGAAARVMYQ